jgi:putative transposon-encoded protein
LNSLVCNYIHNHFSKRFILQGKDASKPAGNLFHLHWATKFNFFGTRGKISVPNRPFNAEFKYVRRFFFITHGFFLTAKLNVKKKCIFTYFTGQQNLTYFGTQGKISVPNRTFNVEFKYVSSFSPSPTVFL